MTRRERVAYIKGLEAARRVARKFARQWRRKEIWLVETKECLEQREKYARRCDQIGDGILDIISREKQKARKK